MIYTGRCQNDFSVQGYMYLPAGGKLSFQSVNLARSPDTQSHTYSAKVPRNEVDSSQIESRRGQASEAADSGRAETLAALEVR